MAHRYTIRAHVDVYNLGHTTTLRITLGGKMWMYEKAGMHPTPLGDAVQGELLRVLGLTNVLCGKTVDLGNGDIEIPITQL